MSGTFVIPAAAGPTTQPSTAKTPMPHAAQKLILEAQVELLRSKLAIELLKNFQADVGKLKPDISVLGSVGAEPAGMPRGSQSREFNGFTYYLVPL